MMLYGKLFKVCPVSSIKRSHEIQTVVAFKVEKRISIAAFFFFPPLCFQEILSVAKKSKVENQVCWHMLFQFKCLKPKRREGFLFFTAYVKLF